MSAELELREVTRRWRAGAGVFEVTLDVERGECLAVVGSSTAGKTTLLRCIAGLEAVDEGVVRLGGRRVSGAGTHLAPHRRQVGMIFQELALWPHRTVEQHLLRRDARRLSRQARRERSLELLDALGIASCRGRLPHQLSGGERQRVALARALAAEPRVLLLDEPVAHLDRPRRRELLRLLARIKTERAVAMVYVTHDREGLASIADRVAVLDAGRVVEVGAVAEMLTAPVSPAGRALLLDEAEVESRADATAAAGCGRSLRVAQPDAGNRMDRRRFLLTSMAAVVAPGMIAAAGGRAPSSAVRAVPPGGGTGADRSLALERVTTVVPFPRGLAVVGDRMFVLARGRVRGAGGVSAQVADLAGTVFEIDPGVAEPFRVGVVGAAVRTNGRELASPTSPPFNLWDRTASPPERDRWTDRPYCTLRFDPISQNFFVCAFSGIDKAMEPGRPSFSKNLTDALFRFDLRSRRWYEIERHRIESGGIYPHHDPAVAPPPHGWLNGPDNCLPLGGWLYAVAKDNSRLVRYDLSAIAEDPHAGAPQSVEVLGAAIQVAGLGSRSFYGHSALATRDGWLYLAYRTSSVIVRLPLGEDLSPVQPVEAELVARFDPYDPGTGRSANLTDMTFDDAGRLYVVSAHPARVHRFLPDAERVFDGRSGRRAPWADLAALTGNPTMKSENLLHHEGRLYVTSGDGYAYQRGAAGTVYRLAVDD